MTTEIEYVHETWNPITGCTQISDGCKHCYAYRMAHRLKGRFGYPEHQPFEPGTVHFEQMHKIHTWTNPRRIFVCSMGDLFHVAVKPADLDTVFTIMELLRHHRYLILTKRPGVMASFLRKRYRRRRPPEHLWFGATIESGEYINRADHLREIDGHTWVSVEPMLGPIFPNLDAAFNGIGWITCGGETEPGARPMHPEWAWRIISWAKAHAVPFFFNRAGAGEEAAARLQVRQFPKGLEL